MHHIKNAQEAGYKDEEIVSAVIASLIPSLTLESVFESTADHILSQLQQYLEAHFREKMQPTCKTHSIQWYSFLENLIMS